MSQNQITNNVSAATTSQIPIGSIIYVQRWAAQRFATTYYYLRACEVALNRRGVAFLRPLRARALYGRRGMGSKSIPELKRFTLPGHHDKGMGYFVPRYSIVLLGERERDAIYSNDNH